MPVLKVIIDCVGPLSKRRKGNEFSLTIMDVTTRFPEAVPLRNIKARTITDALVGFFSRFGLPKQVQHDQGTNFVSGVFRMLCLSLVFPNLFQPCIIPSLRELWNKLIKL